MISLSTRFFGQPRLIRATLPLLELFMSTVLPSTVLPSFYRGLYRGKQRFGGIPRAVQTWPCSLPDRPAARAPGGHEQAVFPIPGTPGPGFVSCSALVALRYAPGP